MAALLFDLSQVVGAAKAVLQEQGVAGRCDVVGGDFFESVPEGADAYMMKHIIHDWDEPAIRILLTCHRAMKPGTFSISRCSRLLLEAVSARELSSAAF